MFNSCKAYFADLNTFYAKHWKATIVLTTISLIPTVVFYVMAVREEEYL